MTSGETEGAWPIFADGVYEGRKMPLDSWLALVLGGKRDKVYPSNAFPSAEMRERYLRGIGSRSEEEVLSLLRAFLVGSSTYGHDDFNLGLLRKGLRPPRPREYTRRLLQAAQTGDPVWEGIWWVLDLLPHAPKEAENVINAFILGYGLVLPDNAFYGLSDALIVLRAKFMEQVPPRQVLLDLTTRDFEFLVSALYHDRGYDTEVTRATRDGGIDVIARKDSPGARETIVISAKRYDPDVPVADVRELHAVQADYRATKGVLATTAHKFTSDAADWAARHGALELVPYAELAVMLNEAFGPHWPSRVTEIVARERRRLEVRQRDAGAEA
jgi:restriction system protein